MKVKNLVLGIGIFIVFMLALGYGIQAFYPEPKYDDYCDVSLRIPARIGIEDCKFSQGLEIKQQACYKVGGEFRYEYDEQGCIVDGYCDECKIAYDEDKSRHAKIVFVIALIVGILILIVGYAILSVEPVGSALMASGVGAIFYGSIRNWINLSNVWRFLLLLLVLALLIWIAIRSNRRKKKGFGFSFGFKFGR
ncbi:MAG: hypothetical protein IIA87_02910 [Nanoarchaeota archaeon]|nr:hypothetical protein [Nanoarchaeota archaeon]